MIRFVCSLIILFTVSCSSESEISPKPIGEDTANDLVYEAFEVDLQAIYGNDMQEYGYYISDNYSSGSCDSIEREIRLYFTATVEINGDLTNIELSREVDECLAKRAIECLKKMPPWTPAIKDGEPVRSRCYLIFPIQKQ